MWTGNWKALSTCLHKGRPMPSPTTRFQNGGQFEKVNDCYFEKNEIPENFRACLLITETLVRQHHSTEIKHRIQPPAAADLPTLHLSKETVFSYLLMTDDCQIQKHSSNAAWQFSGSETMSSMCAEAVN
jgi:hypothetical protein